MEKPFGTDLQVRSPPTRICTRYSKRAVIFRIDHFLGKEPAQNIPRVRLRERLGRNPSEVRNFIGHVQIDVRETLARSALGLL